MAFTKMTRMKSWVLGSLVSDTGSEYLFGFDPEAGLMWLERQGVEYHAEDPIWHEAEAHIRGGTLTVASVKQMMSEGVASTAPEDQYVVPERPSMAEEMGRPKTVTRSVAAAGEMGIASSGFERVGDFGEGQEFEDDEISAQAEMWLQTLEDE